MQPTLEQPIITNPYAVHQSFSVAETSILIAVSLLLALLGTLLIESRTLERLTETFEHVFDVKARRTVRPI